MRVDFIRPGDSATESSQTVVGENAHVESYRSGETHGGASYPSDRLITGQFKFLAFKELREFKFIDLAVSGNEYGHGFLFELINQSLNQTTRFGL